MHFIKNKLTNTPILLIVSVGLIVRFLYYVFLAKSVLGDTMYMNGDTSGWTQSFLNLIHYGHYTFDLSNLEAYFGRVPGYSFYWGLNYFIGGSRYVYQTVASTQIILDSISIYLIYKISLFVFNNPFSAKITALLYCFYPFVIVWVTVSYSEIFSNFLNILCIYLSLKPNKNIKHYFLLGILLAMLFLTREFVAISLVFIILYTLFDKDMAFHARIKNSAIICISFSLLYSLWPIRNYINHDRIILSRSNEGFVNYKQDFRSFRSWVTCWDNDESFWLEKIIKNNYKNEFPRIAYLDAADKLVLQKTLDLCRSCGSSFSSWEAHYGVTNLNRKKEKECNILIANSFYYLQSKFIRENPVTYFTHVPFMNINKIIFKHNLVNRPSTLSQSITFTYRSILVILGLIGILLSFKNHKLKAIPIAGYILFTYLFFSIVIRYIEMRNLIQADTLLLVYAGFAIACFHTTLSKLFYKNVRA